jgi:hypothetical protein
MMERVLSGRYNPGSGAWIPVAIGSSGPFHIRDAMMNLNAIPEGDDKVDENEMW